ncbi:hypothetical protein K0B96_01420 [Horticoccus luteus]|uniref:Lipoprotein SmpA/OmlA domain-containing protein n=1 Tax=Horticoccus luteus TaxID=2862869 RepID=A0A8F9TUG9_9BACT|nr:hypothetical protein [Horticoccus luteus]QYM79306.1 hypothetical protein K0B96_01420 [Horticoccus luteus]
MKTPLLPLLIAAATALVGFSGCQSTQTASTQTTARQTLLSRLTPREQSMIKRHLIGIGFTTDMVLLSLDKPDRVVSGPGPQQETWLYQSYYAADGSSLTPSQRIVTHSAAETGGLGGTGGASGPIARMPGGNPASDAATRNPHTNTYTVEYDPTLFQEKTQSQPRVQVIFLRGLVADIRVEKT